LGAVISASLFIEAILLKITVLLRSVLLRLVLLRPVLLRHLLFPLPASLTPLLWHCLRSVTTIGILGAAPAAVGQTAVGQTAVGQQIVTETERPMPQSDDVSAAIDQTAQQATARLSIAPPEVSAIPPEDVASGLDPAAFDPEANIAIEERDLGHLMLRNRPPLTQSQPAATSITPPIAAPIAPPEAPQPRPATVAESLMAESAIAEAEGEDGVAEDELGQIIIRPDDEDFGNIPYRPVPRQPPPPPKSKWLYVTGRFDYSSNSNAFASTNPQTDALVRTGLTVTALPALGPKTYFLGGIDGNLVRYGKFAELNYDELRLRAGILQQLSPRMYGEIGWSNQKLFVAKDGLRNILSGNRFLNENALRLELSRTDPLGPNWSLNTFYQFRWVSSSRTESDRINHTAVASLNRKLSPSWSAGLDYQVSWSNYTRLQRDDVYQLVQARTSYAFNRNLQMNLFGSFSFGGSSDDSRRFGRTGLERLQYDGWAFGVSLVMNAPLF
jgi:hypothetical protein